MTYKRKQLPKYCLHKAYVRIAGDMHMAPMPVAGNTTELSANLLPTDGRCSATLTKSGSKASLSDTLIIPKKRLITARGRDLVSCGCSMSLWQAARFNVWSDRLENFSATVH